jgi:drug/metabolite transporter (DMT)-like permease
MGPLFATFFPLALATGMLIFFIRRERRKAGRNAQGGLSHRDILDFLMLGALGQLVAQLCVTWGVRFAPASNAALIMLALPICTAMMAYLILGERMTPVRWLSFGLAIIGVLECSGIDWKQLRFTGGHFLLGNLLILLGVNGSAFYNVYSKRVLVRHSPLQVLLYSCYVTELFLLPLTIYLEPDGFRNLPHFDGAVWLALLLLAIFQYCLSMVLFLNVLLRLDATQAALSNYLIPFFGVVVAAIVLHERLTPSVILGGLLVLGSTLLITVCEERQRARVSGVLE